MTMSDFWNTIAGISGDSSVGDTPDQTKQALDDAIADDDGKNNDQWGSSSRKDSGKSVSDYCHHNVSESNTNTPYSGPY
jgi:hypothetical protein